ncbi:MAG: glycosyl transferase family 1 [Crocinitomicaceae bacterium]|nr:glycosyl transferase family 1 [Crocinitomicaceae bacterium]|tara:strand:- start:6287 stop:7489 length:1203 start_codon:yes stop_codon:yes gene_type:complete
MNVLYLTFWGINEGIAQSTVIPHIKILSEFNSVKKIHLSSIERDKKNIKNISDQKINHTPLISKRFNSSLLELINDFIVFPLKLRKICNDNKVNFIIVRGVCAGSIAWILHKLTNIPFYVESFEPHADYMLESKMWSKLSLKFFFQKFFEKKLKKDASIIMPVSNNYKKKLVFEGIDEKKIDVIPCCVDLIKFKRNPSMRKSKRKELKIPENAIVGVYAGKFGGIYYDDKAFSIFKKCQKIFDDNFFLIILSPENKTSIINRLKKHDFPIKSSFINLVPHSKIPNYLSAADFAFSLQKPSPSKKYLSPIKNGEYWASGLPILITEGVGDDSDIIKFNKTSGVNLDYSNFDESLNKMKLILKTYTKETIIENNFKIASDERNFETTYKCYKKIIQYEAIKN